MPVPRRRFELFAVVGIVFGLIAAGPWCAAAEPSRSLELDAVAAAERAWFVALRQALRSSDPAAVAWAATKVTAPAPTGVEWSVVRKRGRFGADAPPPPPPADVLDVLIDRLAHPPGEGDAARAARAAICGALIRLRAGAPVDGLRAVEADLGPSVAWLLALSSADPPLEYLTTALDAREYGLAQRLVIDLLVERDQAAAIAACWRRLRITLRLELAPLGPWSAIAVAEGGATGISVPRLEQPPGFPPSPSWRLSDALDAGAVVLGVRPFIVTSSPAGRTSLYDEDTSSSARLAPAQTLWYAVRSELARHDAAVPSFDDLDPVVRRSGDLPSDDRARAIADAAVVGLVDRWRAAGARVASVAGADVPEHPPIDVVVDKLGTGELLRFTVAPPQR